MNRLDRHLAEGDAPPDENRRPISAYVIFLAALLSLAFIGLNHDFDVIGGRFEETATTGGGLEQQAGVEQSVGSLDTQRKLGFLMILVVGALALVGSPSGTRSNLNAIALLAAAALGWAAASWIWSTSRHETTIELTKLFAFTFTGVALVRRFRVHELLAVFLLVSLVSIAVDCAADVAAGTFRPWTQDFRLGGTLHPNHMGRLGSIVGLIGFAALGDTRWRKWSWFILGIGILVVVMSGSRSGLLGLVAGIATIQLIGMSGRSFALGAASLAVAAAAALMVFAITPPSTQRQVMRALLLGRTEDAGSLTGRMPLWQEMWRDSASRKLQGHGYGAYWTVDRNYDIAEAIQWFPHHSHSAYMEFFIDLGFVGLSLVLALALVTVARCARLAVATGRAEYRLLCALVVCAMANSFLEVGFSTPRFEGLFVGVAVLVLVLRRPETADATSKYQFASRSSRWPPSMELRTEGASRPCTA